MYIDTNQLNNLLQQHPIVLKLWLIAMINGITVNDIKPKLAGQYGISKDMLYKYRSLATTFQQEEPVDNINDDLDAIEAAAAQAYHDELPSPPPEIKLPQSWQEKFKSIDLRSDRLKKASRGYTVPEEEEEEPVSSPSSRKFVPIDIGAIEDDNYSTHDDEAAMEEEQKRRNRMLEMGIVT